MDSVKNLGRVFCSLPEHNDEIISMIDSDPDSKKLLYCCLCMMEKSTQNPLPKTLKTFKVFINDTSQAYEKAKIKACNRGEAPPEFIEQFSKKAEFLDKMTNNVNQQKAKLKTTFDEIREYIMNLISEKEKNYAAMIDGELKAACQLFEKFERVLTTGWPKTAELPQIFPSKDELEQRFAKATDMSKLESLVEKIKEDIKFDQRFSEDNGKESRKTHLEELVKIFGQIETNLPQIDLTELGIGKLTEQLKERLDQVLDKKGEIKNPISNPQLRIRQLLKQKDLDLLRNWLPNQYKLDLKPLYQSSVDGQAASDFHRKCDGQGPTITLIKCRFPGSDQDSIIGGFNDQSWHSNSLYTRSQDAFIFSLTTQKKCPVNSKTKACYGGADRGPAFGSGHDICVGPASGYVNPCSYFDTNTLVDSPSYSGSGQCNFVSKEVEVYSIN